MTGVVANIMRFAVNDGPGIRTTVFLKGCPLRCQWCHNPETISPRQEIAVREDRCIGCGACVEACEEGATLRVDGALVFSRASCVRCGRCVEACCSGARGLVGREMTAEEVVEEIRRDEVFYGESGGGATFSGGEPLLQHEFLLALLRGSRERGIHTAVDTSGYAAAAVLETVASAADLFLYDLKLIDEERHRRFTGVSNRVILDNLRRLAGRGARVVVRVPLIPGVNDDEENIEQTGRLVASVGGVTRIDVLPYHDSGAAKSHRLGETHRLPPVSRPMPAQLEWVAAILRRHITDVSIGG